MITTPYFDLIKFSFTLYSVRFVICHTFYLRTLQIYFSLSHIFLIFFTISRVKGNDIGNGSTKENKQKGKVEKTDWEGTRNRLVVWDPNSFVENYFWQDCQWTCSHTVVRVHPPYLLIFRRWQGHRSKCSQTLLFTILSGWWIEGENR